MTRRVVCDASAITALLIDSGGDGSWAAEMLSEADLYAPTLLPYECVSVLRRHELAGSISPDQAAQAHADLLELPIEYWPHDVMAQRIWELHANLISYDAAYVALAESIEAPVITLDRHLQRAPHLRCDVVCP